MKDLNCETVYPDYLESLLSGDRNRCYLIVRQLIDAGTSVRILYTDLFQRSMYEVGSLWEQNRISVAVEHLATSITESMFPLVYPIIFSAEHIGKTAIISCIANEYHQIGGKMIADIFELNGWDGYFLGANTPLQDLLHMIDDKRPDVLGLSVSIYEQSLPLAGILDRVKDSFPDLTVIVGGQAFVKGDVELGSHREEIRYINSAHELEACIQREDFA
ncbi:cobalamin B12-binding domain-containing protein [Spirochaeta dissipatitropha]